MRHFLRIFLIISWVVASMTVFAEETSPASAVIYGLSSTDNKKTSSSRGKLEVTNLIDNDNPFSLAEEKRVDSKIRFNDLYGEVSIRPDYEEDDAYEFAELDTIIYEEDRIRTKEESGAILGLEDMSTYVIKPESILIIRSEEENVTKFEILYGRIMGNIKKMAEGKTMGFEMSQCVAGIKGTVFRLSQSKDGSVNTVEVTSGLVEVTLKSDRSVHHVPAGKCLLVKKGEEAVISDITKEVEKEILEGFNPKNGKNDKDQKSGNNSSSNKDTEKQQSDNSSSTNENEGKKSDNNSTSRKETNQRTDSKTSSMENVAQSLGNIETQNTLEVEYNGQKVSLVKCSAGSFMMGSPKEEPYRESDEEQHQVTISKDFYMARFPVTQELYQAVMKNNPSEFKDSNNPVEKVSWNNAKEFCYELNQIASSSIPEGYKFDLPTEAQWEYACRAGTTTPYNNPEIDSACWHKNISQKRTHTVGQKVPNAWGLYDMHGNVFEWCRDWYETSYSKLDPNDPEGPKYGNSRVARGGNWNLEPQKCRSAYRKRYGQDYKSDDCGFRIALVQYEKPRDNRIDKDKKVFNVKGLEFIMEPIPAGTFIMGSPKEELGRENDEEQHRVTISKAFYMAQFPVTQALYKAVMNSAPSAFPNDNNPVEKVSWNNAKEFCYELNRIASSSIPEGYRFDLPTESQWEYACRAGTTTSLNNGEDITNENGICAHTYEIGWTNGYSEKTTHSVGLKSPNAWGLYDMHGNVFEWCKDWYETSYPEVDTTDPEGAKFGNSRVVRGGNWKLEPKFCRSAYRKRFGQDHKADGCGFRIVLVPYDKPKDNRKNKNQKVFKVKDIEFVMEPIPEGTFIMGSQKEELGRENDEEQHQVTISKAFYMARFPVTQALYQAVMKNNPSEFKDSNNPVEKVSWIDAKEFCNQLNQMFASSVPNGYRFDLPTESQWEYACRAGTTTSLNNGENITITDGICAHTYGVGWTDGYSEKTAHPVGLKSPNAWGLYDMHGNVLEWCRDFYTTSYPEVDTTDPEGPKSGGSHVVRGGSWKLEPKCCRSAYRKKYDKEHRANDCGFRIVLAPPANPVKEEKKPAVELPKFDNEMPATEAKPVRK